jgi:hypothetical protein
LVAAQKGTGDMEIGCREFFLDKKGEEIFPKVFLRIESCLATYVFRAISRRHEFGLFALVKPILSKRGVKKLRLDLVNGKIAHSYPNYFCGSMTSKFAKGRTSSDFTYTLKKCAYPIGVMT